VEFALPSKQGHCLINSIAVSHTRYFHKHHDKLRDENLKKANPLLAPPNCVLAD
jgi:hypothetical protein